MSNPYSPYLDFDEPEPPEQQEPRIPRWVWWLALGILGPSLLGFGGQWLWTLRPLPEPRRPTGKLSYWSATPWDRTTVDHETCYLLNNQWNVSGNAEPVEQEIFVQSDAASDSFGWRWRAPWRVFHKIVAFPELICGLKPWDTPLGRVDGLPAHPGAQHISADFHIDLKATGNYDMAFELWAVSSLPATPDNIRTEIMIWNVNSGQRPSGKLAGTVNLDGVNWEVWVNPRQKDDSGKNVNTWTYIAFVATRPVLDGPLDLSGFLDWSLAHNYLTPELYISDVELGNEVAEGSGYAEIHNFKLRIQ